MKLTGERPIEGETPDSLLALHSAGYREVEERISDGHFLDLGCGLGDGTARFAAEGRRLTGVDYDPATAALAASQQGPHRPEHAVCRRCCSGFA